MTAFLSARRTAAAVLLSSALVACGDDGEINEPGERNIAELTANTAQLSTLNSALVAADLSVALEASGPYTVFAPVNDAFTALPDGVAEGLLDESNRTTLQQLLRYHVVPGSYTAAQLTDGQELVTLTGETLTVRIDGSTVTVDGVEVTTPDVQASNGIVHLVDGVLTQGLDLVEIASLTADLSTLVGAVQTAGLGTALGGENLTIFAPSNAAFAALGDAVPTDPSVLAQVLQLHVVGSRTPSASLSDGQTITSLLGPNLTVGIDGSTVTITGPTNTVTVTTTDINASNGVIHVIDGVLLP